LTAQSPQATGNSSRLQDQQLTNTPAAVDIKSKGIGKTPVKPQSLERIRPELNLEKWAIWQPAKSKLAAKARVLKREIQLEDGSRVTAKVEIAPTTRGDLTTEDAKMLYVLIKHWEDRGRTDTFTPVSLKRLAKLLKKQWGTNVITAITESLIRLRITPFIWENSYYDKSSGEVVESIEAFNILSDLKIIKRKQDGHVTREGGYFKFNDFILRNLLANHTKPLLLDVVLGFKSEIAQMLYVHLDLILADKTFYERRSKELFEDLGLEGTAYRYRSNRKQILERAFKELQGVQMTTGRIADIHLEQTKDDDDYKMIVRKGKRTAIPLDDRAEVKVKPSVTNQTVEHLRLQAAELVRHFYKLFQGNEKAQIPSKALNQAISLIAAHGLDQARFIVEYAHRVAPETGYKPQTFGGIMHYAARALAAQAEEARMGLQRQEQERARQAEAARQALEIAVEEKYEAYCKQMVDEHLSKNFTPAILAARVQSKKRELLQSNRSVFSVWNPETFDSYALRMVRIDLAKEIAIDTFDEFARKQQAG
jgi:hypothetical protein